MTLSQLPMGSFLTSFHLHCQGGWEPPSKQHFLGSSLFADLEEALLTSAMVGKLFRDLGLPLLLPFVTVADPVGFDLDPFVPNVEVDVDGIFR